MKALSSSTELEQEILATAFLGNHCVEKIITYCKDRDFYFKKHKVIFASVLKMFQAEMLIEPTSLVIQMGTEWAYDIATIAHHGLTDVYLDQHIYQLKKLTQIRTIQNLDDTTTVDDLREIIFSFESDNYPTKPKTIPNEVLKEAIIEYYEKGELSGISTGWPKLDSYYTVSKGQLTVITGIPNHGKSEWLDALTVNLAKNNNWKFLYFSPENFPVARHLRKLIEKYSGLPLLGGTSARLSKGDIEKSLDWVISKFKFLNPENENRSIEYLLANIENVDGFIIDPWNEIEARRPAGMSETEFISQCLAKARSVALSKNIHIWIVAHPTKLAKTDEGVYPVPSPYDISGSANWRNKADNILAIYRMNDTTGFQNKIEVHVQKIRFKDNGKIGKIELYYDPICGRFYEKFK